MTRHIPVNCTSTECSHYGKCALLPTSVYDIGTTVDLMIVGQGAGWQEERDHRPWIGKAGELLRTVLRSVFEETKPIGVALANTVRCRPTEPAIGGRVRDRAPNPAEVRSCMKYLTKDIAELKPYVVLLMGGAVAAAFGYAGAVGSLRKTPKFVSPDKAVMITYHPAGVLRQPNLMTYMRSDIEKAIYLARMREPAELVLPF